VAQILLDSRLEYKPLELLIDILAFLGPTLCQKLPNIS